jgi:micrococcal nuclease
LREGNVEELELSMFRRFCFTAALFIGLFMGPLMGVTASYAAQRLPGPYSFEVLRVVDGDTFEARVPIWLGQSVTVKIRLTGVDTPEMRGKCPEETELAERARRFTQSWLAQDGLRLVDIKYGTYAGRVLATARSQTGQTLSQALLGAELAKPYLGRRAQWCAASP